MTTSDNVHSKFTETEYGELVDVAALKYTFAHYDDHCDGPVVCWRHDVDYSPQRALKMAETEAVRSLSCIYHILLTGKYYSVFEPAVTEIFQRISDLGHVLGLHFDFDGLGMETDIATERVVDRIAFEKNTLEKLLERKLRSLSFHNSTLNQDRFLRTDAICGMVNVTSPSIWNGYKYVSDSNGIWRHDRLHDILSQAPYEKLHVLTHPVWWTPTQLTPTERLRRAVEGRAQAGIDFYATLLKRDGRFDFIAEYIGFSCNSQ